VRDYNRESSLGNFVADVMREMSSADVAFENAGGLRADLPQGAVANGGVLDALPFLNSLSGKSLSDAVIEYLQKHREVGLPQAGRLIPVSAIR